jgi:hypothetical protein
LGPACRIRTETVCQSGSVEVLPFVYNLLTLIPMERFLAMLAGLARAGPQRSLVGTLTGFAQVEPPRSPAWRLESVHSTQVG